jgi:hypothetical protein
MSVRPPLRLAARLIVPALVIAALAIVSAPREPDRQDPALEAFLSLGGDFADICGQHGHPGRGRHCDACRLVTAAILPTPPGDWLRTPRLAILRTRDTRLQLAATGTMRRPWAPRAPPNDAA